MADMCDVEMINYIQRLPQNQRPAFQMAWNAQKKDQGTALVLSLLWLLGISGVGRMYAGDILFGLALFFLGPCTCYIWPLVDTFLVKQAVNDHNRNVLLQLKAAYPAY